MYRNLFRILSFVLVFALATGGYLPASAAGSNSMIGINIVLNTDVTDAILADLGTHGMVRDVIHEIRAVTLQARSGDLNVIRALPYVGAANPDAERSAGPVDTVTVDNFSAGLSPWDQDAINVTDFGSGRTVAFDGSGVYVAVLDTGLLDTWRQYFPEERIATQFAIAFGGGGGEVGTVSTQPNKWEHDQSSHGTVVTSTIIGYNFFGTPVNGTAPMATIIPVKVLDQTGWAWSSVVARGIIYVANLKTSGALGSSPVVINMSLGYWEFDAVEKAAIDYAIAQGVIIVASAGNRGESGMGYPAAYAPVISVAASGWIGQWTATDWWRTLDVPDPTRATDYYVADFSSRELPGQDLDVAAPGAWVLGPWQLQSGKISYYYLRGTSMAGPHVAGIVALMLQKKASLTQSQVESILESSAIRLPAGCRTVLGRDGATVQYCWEADATGAGLATADAALAKIR